MKKLGLILALALVSATSVARPSLAQNRGYDAAPSLQEFNHSANGG